MPSVDSNAGVHSNILSKPFSLSFSSIRESGKASPKAPIATSKPTTEIQGRKRPYSALADPDSEPEDSIDGRHETVVGFGRDGKTISAADVSNKKHQPLVIKAEKSGRDWREETRRRRGKKNLLPAEVQMQHDSQMGGMGDVDSVEVSVVGGLKVANRKVDENRDSTTETAMAKGEEEEVKDGEKQLTADEEAVAALLDEGRKSTRIISAAEGESAKANGDNTDADRNEADRFRADVESRPPPASLDAYAAVPVEEFGAAVLRGLGWKEGNAIGKRKEIASTPREVRRRPALLGLGAKETPGGISGEELGAWNQKKGRGNEKVSYNPLMLKNSVTGEIVTEEELELRKLEAKQRKRATNDDWRERRDQSLWIDDSKERDRLRVQSGSGRPEVRSIQQLGNQDGERYMEKRKRDQKPNYSSRDRSRSRERRSVGSSRRERYRSKEREYRKRDDDRYDRQRRDKESSRRDEYRGYDRRVRDLHND